MYRILLLDNELDVLHGLRRELLGEYEVEAYAAAQEALTRARKAPFDLVIADYHMPDMDGVQFLKHFAEIQPDAVRMILSGHMDINGLLGAINESHVYRFLAKPWATIVLKSEIARALNYRAILLENRRLAEAYRGSSIAATPNREKSTHQYRIAAVDGDEAVLGLISNGLALGVGEGLAKDVLWREVSCDHPAVPADIELLVDTFHTGSEALAHTRFANYDLVMAAQTMLDMDCIQFLQKWRQVQPDAARILMGNVTDVALLQRAINEAEIYCYLDFNWENNEMKTDVRRRIWQIHHLQSAVMEALAARQLVLENARLAREIREYGW